VQDVKLSGDKIQGRWADQPRLVGAAALEDFVNMEATPEAIYQFTKRFGPLTESHCVEGHDWKLLGTNHSKPSKGAGFSFQLDEWRKQHKAFQHHWWIHTDACIPLPPGLKIINEPPRDIVLRGQRLRIVNVKQNRKSVLTAELTVRTLWEFLLLQLDSLNPRHLKVCANPECQGKRRFPFFHRQEINRQALLAGV